jgi:drug/metabolite transporter (DMT)-like permease
METFRRFFVAWIFAMVSALCLVLSFPLVRRSFQRYEETHALFILIPVAFLLASAAILGMAWWTTWMKKSSARAWGVAASLLCLLVPLSSMYFFHSPFGDSKYKGIIFGILALIAYLWPDGHGDTYPGESQEDDEAMR